MVREEDLCCHGVAAEPDEAFGFCVKLPAFLSTGQLSSVCPDCGGPTPDQIKGHMTDVDEKDKKWQSPADEVLKCFGLALLPWNLGSIEASCAWPWQKCQVPRVQSI